MGIRLPRRWGVVAAYAALTLVFTYPLSVDPAGSVLTDAPDTNVFMWTLAWNTHALTAQPFSMFDANIYYPQSRTLAYSDNMIGNVLFAAPVLWLTGNLVLAFNTVAIVCCFLCGLGAYLLARRLEVSPSGAFLCGLIYEFAPPRFLRFGQLTLGVHWIPFTLAYLHAYFKDGRRRDLRLAAVFFTLQVLTSGHGAVFVLLAALALVLYRFALGEPLAIGRRARDLGVPGVLALVPVVLMVIPYLAVQREMGLRRFLENWAVPGVSFLASPTFLHSFVLSMLSATSVNSNALAYLFPGYLPVILAAFAVFARRSGMMAGSVAAELAPPTDLASPQGRPRSAPTWRLVAVTWEIAALVAAGVAVFAAYHGPFRIRIGEDVIASVRQPWRVWLVLAIVIAVRFAIARYAPFNPISRFRGCRDAYRRWSARLRDDNRTFYVLMLLVSYWLSIGPPLGLWPAVYWLPGFNFIRVPSRFTILSVLSLGVLAGMGFDWLALRFSPARRRIAAGVVASVLVAEFLVPWNTTPRRVDIPAIDRWLDTQPKPFVVAEVPLPPFGAGGAWERRQTEFMLHATAHWQKTVHGYSGLRPSLHEVLYQQMRTFPDARSLAALRQLGVTYIVVHADLYEPEERPLVEARLDEYRDSLRLERVDGTGRVYSLRPPLLNAMTK